MTYTGPLRMQKLDVAAVVPLQQQLQCASCLQSLIDKQRFKCSQCNNTIYCSAHCQEQHWVQFHSKECGCHATPMENILLRLKNQNYINFDQLQQIEYQSNHLLAVIQLPSPETCLYIISFSNYDETIHFGRYLICVQNIMIQFDQLFNTFCKIEQPQQIFYRSEVKEDQKVILNNKVNTFSTWNIMYDGLKLICCECKGPVSLENQLCLKCKKDNTSFYQPQQKEIEEYNLILKFLSVYSNYQLFFPGKDASECLNTKHPLRKYLSQQLANQQNYQQYIQKYRNIETLIREFTAILKKNYYHHLSYHILEINQLVFKYLKYNSQHKYFNYVQQLLEPVDVYSLAFAFLKSSIHHYSVFTIQVYNVLYIIVEILNTYTLNELESKSLPPLMKASDEQVDIPESEQLRMASVAEELLKGHNNCISFANQLRDLSERLKDEKIQNDVDRLISQIDCRIENLESWCPDYDEADEQLVVKGEQYDGSENQPRKNQVDIID